MIVYYLIISLIVHLSAAISILERVPDEVCSFSIDGHIYDLSELAKKDWKFSEVFHADLGSKKHYIGSVCHYLKNLDGCEESSVCFTNTDNTKSTSIYQSGGKSIIKNSPPVFLGEGHLRFDYLNGSNCTSRRTGSNYSTQLFLQCPLDNERESNGPILMGSGCTFMFVWITKAACPRKHRIGKNSCIMNFDNGNSINLNALNLPSFYSVRNNDLSFEVNICGPIKNGSCKGNETSICDISDSSNPITLALHQHKSLKWNKENGTIDMLFNESNVNVSIQFECDRKILKSQISLKSKQISGGSSVYTFKVKSNFACVSTETNCVLRNSNGSVIDLRPLQRKESNWEIFTPLVMEKKGQAQHYLLNVCGPLTNVESNGCPRGPIGACIASVIEGASLNLGYVTSDPVLSEDGSISILYTGGDPCKKGVESSSTKINLFCSETEHMPVLVAVTSSCLHIFEWRTPAACPMGEIIGESCKIKDPLHGEVFDLNLLRNSTSDYIIESAYYNFTINVCGPLLSDCNGSKSSVCTLGNDKKSGGKSPGTLLFDDGTLLMEFDDGASCNSGRWSSKILILCNQNALNSAPEHFQTNNDTCTHVFIWYTFFACPSFTSVDCFIQDQNNVYDLSPLSEPMDNWFFESTQNGTSRKYIFNICRSVVHSKEYRCPYKAGSCLMDSKTRKSLSLGNVVSSPYIKNGTIMLHYTGGDVCSNNKRHETLIVFECVPWTYNSLPALIKEDNCQTVINVPTNHACPRRLFKETIGNCTITNPFTNYLYDLSTLRSNKPFNISYGHNSSIFLNVCGHVEDNSCSPAGSGSCWLERNGSESKIFNMGLANSTLQFSNWNIFLEYKDGDSCYSKVHGTVQRSTKISFVCSDKHVSGPVITDYDNDSCTLYVSWHTELACERQLNCFAKTHDNRMFSLAPFVKYFGNYEIINPYYRNTTYYINICKPLTPMKGIRCHPSSAACMVVENSEGSRDVSSLGNALIPPVVISNDDVVLMYSHGSSCPMEGLSSTSLSSRVTFICNKTVGVGAPVFIRQTHDCQVLFEWHTSLVCPSDIEHNTHFGSQCHIRLEKAKANTDIMPLYKPGGYTVKYGDKTYKVNVCGSVCEKSGVCTEDGISYGLVDNVKLSWESDMLKLAYYTGDPCSQSVTYKRSSIIYFECDMTAGYGLPAAEAWNKVDSCVMVFNWRTNVTCIEAIYKPEELTTTTMINVTTIPASAVPKAKDYNNSGNVGVSILIVIFVGSLVLVTSAVLFFRSLQGRRLTTQAKGFFRRKGYSNVFSQTENDNLLGGGSYVYRVEEDEQVLRV